MTTIFLFYVTIMYYNNECLINGIRHYTIILIFKKL